MTDSTKNIIERIAEGILDKSIEEIRATPLCQLREEAEKRTGRPVYYRALQTGELRKIDTGYEEVIVI